MRAFYCVPEDVWDDPTTERPGDVAELSRASGIVNVLAPSDPHPAMEHLGGLMMGNRLSQLEPEERQYFAAVRVRRTIGRDTGAGVELLTIPATELTASDEETGEPEIPRLIFAGDDITDYQ